MGRDEVGVGQEGAPLTPDLDEIGAIRSKAMQKDDKLAGLARLRPNSRTVDRRSHMSRSPLFDGLAVTGSRAEVKRRRRPRNRRRRGGREYQ